MDRDNDLIRKAADASEHVRTYQNFVLGVRLAVLTAAVTLILLAYFLL